jgi:hypothetical protein
LAEQIAGLKQQLAMGQPIGTSGTAGSGWGLGTSAQAVAPAAAPNKGTKENRQGNQTLGDTKATQFEPLYQPQDYANQSYDTKVQGQLDISQSPQKVELIRSSPESQQALAQYANVLSAYANGEETAVEREQVPTQYQELVKLYFDQLQQQAAKDAEQQNEKPAEKAKGKK